MTLVRFSPLVIICCISLFLIVFSIFSSVGINDSFAHQDGCHSNHSCPSDSGSYTCGDKGYCSQCNDNKYCKTGMPITNTKQTSCSGTFESKVSKIVDGDTLYVISCKNSIRLSLVDTPEKGDAGYKEAKSFTASFCKVGSKIKVDQDDLQKGGSYDRLVGKVYCNGKNLNEVLVESGHAVILHKYCSKSEFASESWAKKHGC